MIDLLFAFINFAILVALGVYGYSAYAAPGIRHAIQQEQAEHDQLIAQRTQLREVCRGIEERISEQEKQYHELYDLMTQWSYAVQESRRERERVYHEIREHVRDKRNRQRAYRAQRHALQYYIPRAFHDAEQQMRHMYHGERGISYIKQVVNRVEHHHE